MTSQQPDRLFSFVKQLWPSIPEKHVQSSVTQYARLSQKLEHDLYALVENPDAFALRSPEDILSLVHDLQRMNNITREEALTCLCRLNPEIRTDDDECSLRTIRCAVNVWLHISMGHNAHIRRPLEWRPGQSLKDAISSLFNENLAGQLKFDQQQLPVDLTAASLVNHHGYSIQWTHDLTAHLSIDWKHKVLTVYEHKIVAYNHIRYGTSSLPVPDQLYQEVIDTLNLLFPFQDGATEKLLAKQSMTFHRLGFCNRPRKLLLNDYHYWRGQIYEFYEITQGPPIGIQQLFLDDDGKNLVSTFNFWIAVVVGLLTVMGMAIAIVALVYSIKQYWLGLKQYELSVAQACVDSSVRQLVPHLCGG